MGENFFSRWSKRKDDVREGKAVEPEPVVEEEVEVAAPPAAEPAPEPPPTLEDVQSLTPQSDFSRFARSDVPADVKNAAMKKLFSDPHFNVMDRLDTYIDDYNTPDPIPPELLRQLVSAQFLDLFDERKNAEKANAEGREVADDPAAQTMAESGTAAPAVPAPEDHADPDLRLQQDHAPGRPGPGQGTE